MVPNLVSCALLRSKCSIWDYGQSSSLPGRYRHDIVVIINLINLLSLLKYSSDIDPCPHAYTFNPATKACYYVPSKAKATWEEARQVCKADGGDLASVGNREENAFIKGKKEIQRIIDKTENSM